MSLQPRFLSTSFTIFVAAACAGTNVNPTAPIDLSCTNSDNRALVKGGDECLVIRTFDKKLTAKRPTLVVFLHGDKSSGNPIEWEYETVASFANTHTVSVVLLRPGYDDIFGNSSTGDDFGRRDSYTSHNIAAVAQAIKTLKQHHKAAKLVLVGYSGGAAYVGVILGQYPTLVEAAILLACPCNIGEWRESNEWRPYNRSLSPHAYVNRVPKTTRVIAVTGTYDGITDTSLAKDYVKMLQKRSVVAEFRPASGATHDSVPGSQVFLDAVNELTQLYRGLR